MSVKNVIRKAFSKSGYEIRRRAAHAPPAVIALNINLVFDVGANVGQYGVGLRRMGYEGRIVSFEPLPDEHSKLSSVAKEYSNWVIHPRTAVGSANGSTEINLASNSYSSSILPMLELHSSAAPDSVYVSKIATPVITLDSIFAGYSQESSRIFVKIDTQGFESAVLAGMTDCLDSVLALEIEMSVVPLYSGQALYREILDQMSFRGFDIWAVHPGFYDPTSGRMLQFDATFIRSNAVS